MIGQATSDRAFTLENDGVVPPVEQPCAQVSGTRSADPKFQARMSLLEARATLIAATRAMSFCGFSQRAGMIAREVCGIKFGSYRPSDIMELMRRPEFQQGFEQALESWRSGWHPGVSSSSMRLRERQYRACRAFIRDRGWTRVADAVESMLAARAQHVLVEDSAGNRRSQRLIDVLDLFFHIPMTGARSARMRVVETSE
ncbi:MAG TPA: hypothetical protein VGQ99_15405 [Tepidisphaeraceae bacterium]|jgi:hypothetical protein|nr:hypothetical protein [Tepidisphaeraceae bacterium]